MSAEEVFSGIAAHMAKGLMFHSQMADCFLFLGLRGFEKEQECHYLDESLSYRKLNRYYTEHYNRLVPEAAVENPGVIPAGWYKYSRQDVDGSTKRNTVRDGFSKWVQWESETKTLYEKATKDLLSEGDIAGALKTGSLVRDVSAELARAEEEQLSLEATGYDLSAIIEMQDALCLKYADKMKEHEND